MDFTLKKYKELLQELKSHNYTFQTFEEFLKKPIERSIVLRHDVDLLPEVALEFAKIQSKEGVKGSYYFRAVPESWDDKIITEIYKLGHEIGYHYECLTTSNGDLEMGILDFKMNLAALRLLAPVSTICMHGSPRSKYDSRDLWKNFDYKAFGITGEPYFDVDFNEVFYLTDTGRMWDGNKVSVRDKVVTSFNKKFHSTNDIMFSIKNNEFPNKCLFTFHPARWHDSFYLWTKELVLQNIKNLIKKYFYVTFRK